MPTRDDILRDLIRRVEALEAAAHEPRGGGWEAEFEPSPGAPTAPAPAYEQEVDDEGNVGDVVITPPTPQQTAAREALLDQIDWVNWSRDQRGGPPPLPEAEACDAYMKGGLVWLYLYDRHFVMQQRPTVVQRMVQELALSDPKTALEISMDVLKDQSPSGGTAVAEDNARSEWDR
jgi:hypothetical protein